MNAQGSVLIKVAAICLIVLIVVSAGWSLMTSLGLVNSFGGGRFPNGGAGGFAGRNFNDGNRNFQPPQGFQQGQPGFQPPDGSQSGGTQQGQQGFQGNFRQRPGLFNLFGIFRWVGFGISIAALIAGVFAVIGLFRRKIWGKTLAIILAALLALSSLLGFLRFTLSLSTGIALLRFLLAAAVIVLLVLPATRAGFKPTIPAGAAADDEEDLDYRTVR